MVKKILATILIVFLLLMVPILAMKAKAETVASGSCGPNVTWTLDDEGTLNINGSGKMYDYSLGFGWNPNTPWDSFRVNINSVNISLGITYIGEHAFDCCQYLTSVTIPNSVTSIGN